VAAAIFNHDLSFGVLTNAFILGWVLLLIGLWCGEGTAYRRWILALGGRVIPISLLVFFVIGYVLSRDQPGGITSFALVLTTYSVPDKVLSAWAELLGLALFVCRWVVDDSARLGVPKFLAAFSIVLGLLAAAFGLLFYIVVRLVYLRSSPGNVSSH